MLIAGFISTILGTKLPGPGTIFVRQELNFLAPVRIGDTITARAEISEIIPDKKHVKMTVTCTNQDGTVVLDGESTVSPPRAPKPQP